jgi:hypothetical protein
VTSGQDAHPALPAPTPPDHTRLQQARADRAEREAKERKFKRQPCRTRNLGLHPRLLNWYCIGTAFCGYANNEVETGMQAALMQQQKCAGAQRAHIHRRTHRCTHAQTHMHRRTHARTHTHTLLSTLAHTHTHTRSNYSTQAAHKASTCVQ